MLSYSIYLKILFKNVVFDRKLHNFFMNNTDSLCVNVCSFHSIEEFHFHCIIRECAFKSLKPRRKFTEVSTRV